MAVAKGPDEEELEAIEEALLGFALTLRAIARGYRDDGNRLSGEASAQMAQECLEAFGVGWRRDGR